MRVENDERRRRAGQHQTEACDDLGRSGDDRAGRRLLFGGPQLELSTSMDGQSERGAARYRYSTLIDEKYA